MPKNAEIITVNKKTRYLTPAMIKKKNNLSGKIRVLMPDIIKLSVFLFLVSSTILTTFYFTFNSQKEKFKGRKFDGQDHLSKYVRRVGYNFEPEYSSLNANYNNPSFNTATQAKIQSELAQTATALTSLQLQMKKANPFQLLNAYKAPSKEFFNAFPGNVPLYKFVYLGLKHNPSYCDVVDVFNLYNPQNIFQKMNFVGDYPKSSLVKENVFRKIGDDIMPKIGMEMNNLDRPLYDLDITATAFFTKRVTFHNYYEIGKDFLCTSQIYGHIPGHGTLTRKDLNVKAVNDYAVNYESKPECFNKKMFFPYAYRLNGIRCNPTECAKFFEELKSEEYRLRRQNEPITFIIKKGYGAHRASGLEMFDETKEDEMRKLYREGELCGTLKQPILAQFYISNPLLLDKKNKFDFRMYMLIASVNPLIVYYHDGFLRVSLQPYDKNSTIKAVHFTNTHLSKEIFQVAREEEEFQGMTETELRDYQMWTMEQLQAYLLETEDLKGKISDQNWLDNYLRPKFKEAYLHTVRMSKKQFFKHSGVFEMFGLDFLLDDDLNLWFIECNGSPQLIGTNTYKTEFLTKMLQDMFEIQYVYLRSRWKRIQRLMRNFHDSVEMNKEANLTDWQQQFDIINTNYLEPEFKISETNSWQLIMDANIEGKAAYLGNIDDKCLEDV